MHGIIALAGLLFGCGRPDITVSPLIIDWGQVDFQQPLPGEGYNAQALTITNAGERDLDAAILGFDFDRSVLGAFLAVDDPPTLTKLAPGQSQVITLGVYWYDDEAGERDTLVQGDFSIGGDEVREAVVVPWSYTPIRNIDTGL